MRNQGEGEAGSIIFVFFNWGYFDRQWMGVDGVEQKVSFVFSFLVLL